MLRDDREHPAVPAESGTGSPPAEPSSLEPKTARTDNLAAIMRDSTIILDVPVYPVGKVHVEKAIRLDSPVTDPGLHRRNSDDE